MAFSNEFFLTGCGLPAAWSGQAQWRILETGFEQGLNFLVTWATWKADPFRPKILHFVSTEVFPASTTTEVHSPDVSADLQALSVQLQAQLWGLLPGFHRLVFEDGQVLLTLCIGDLKEVLRQQTVEADSVYLNADNSQINPDAWDLDTFKAIARCCRRGTRITTKTGTRSARDALAQCGFMLNKTVGLPTQHDDHQLQLHGEYNPAWKPKKPSDHSLFTVKQPTKCVVVGAGLAGAAIAASLARRGWQVVVLDAASAPASGASGLPAGLVVPHVSPDNSLLSRLSRNGVRVTLQQAQTLLVQGCDWNHTGVLEHGVDGMTRVLPQAWSALEASAAAAWCYQATPEQLAKSGLSGSSAALWHMQAGWIKPASLVNAWLNTSGITWRGDAHVAQLRSTPENWQLLDACGELLAQADLVVIAAAYGSRALAATVNTAPLPLQPIRGQVTWGRHHTGNHGADCGGSASFADFPVNGHGALIPTVPSPYGMTWVLGSSYERDLETPEIKTSDHLENLARLQTLLPKMAAHLTQEFDANRVFGWAGIRCATPSRLPVVGQIAVTQSGAQVWVCSGMGSRGLTFAALCAELIAAKLHNEPLPLEKRLAHALSL